MPLFSFDNRFARELPGDPLETHAIRQVKGALWSRVLPTPVAAPRLLAWSPEMAAELDLGAPPEPGSELLAALAGNAVLPGSEPLATCYGGHQFGQWAGQLGDGRAILLGEVINRRGARWELQLKGAGLTPYSRRADGRAVLRSSLREFLCSEAMHHLGVPTTRALSLVGTGEAVIRDMFYDGNPRAEPGAIVCRVAPSFTRFGHFEMLAARGEGDLLRQFVDFTQDRDFADSAFAGAGSPERLVAWFVEICRRTARLMAEWMRVGFVHGVMNTDNMSILGLTIDYGPYGWIDAFDPGWTPNTTDAAGRRYCFGRQPEIAQWNLERLADALGTLLPEGQALEEGIGAYCETYNDASRRMFAAKFGLRHWQKEDAELVGDAFGLMQEAEVDMTIFFRQLASVRIAAPDVDRLFPAFYGDSHWQQYRAAFAGWLRHYAARLQQEAVPDDERRLAMNRVNPCYVPRNYLAQQAIDQAEAGDTSMIDEWLAVLRHPYDEQPGREAYAARRPEWARHKAGCSMLSCSS